jgi:hypothetical protein
VLFARWDIATAKKANTVHKCDGIAARKTRFKGCRAFVWEAYRASFSAGDGHTLLNKDLSELSEFAAQRMEDICCDEYQGGNAPAQSR